MCYDCVSFSEHFIGDGHYSYVKYKKKTLNSKVFCKILFNGEKTFFAQEVKIIKQKLRYHS